ncbi:hypothetical protein [Klebsiella pneumoniae]|uniref:hypothetical protein n=1 Tax=Klebsiella pneumoniae TaxID=573 RepID=UPI00188281BF|nr:hypothetical protein [Klebsiella pneumoniae]MBE9267945.1 hypothetical protein [Klebsiella pneumoniae]MBF8021324.1 hypothetical protein [Klebsiella pneumoniae]MBF8046607.1 hypothetical protein [Klebsiella pneumoniae]
MKRQLSLLAVALLLAQPVLAKDIPLNRAAALANSVTPAASSQAYDDLEQQALAQLRHALQGNAATLTRDRLAHTKQNQTQADTAWLKASGTSLAECAKSSVKDDPWRDPAMRDFSRFTMTYDLPQQKGPQPRLQVPEGAEVLLKDALPHLSAAQRRTLMVNTALPAGYPLSGTTPEQQFWQRLNLSAAWEMAQKRQ